MTNLDEWWKEQIQIQEASLRHIAGLPPRSDRERDFYRTWTDYDARNPQSAQQNASHAADLRSKKPEELWDIAASTVAAQREACTPVPDWLAEPEQSSSWDAEMEAGS
ncbi:MAG: hypothetical protein ACRDNZ_23825 [Streptosporangiaceae bacterium]